MVNVATALVLAHVVDSARSFASGSPPDVFYLTDGTYPFYAKQGVLEDMSDVVGPIKDRLMPGIVDTVTMGGRDGKRSIYAAPIHMQNMHYHYWKDMVEEAGLTSSDV